MATAYLNLEGIGKVEASCCYFYPYCIGWQHLLNGVVLHDLIGDLLCGGWHWVAQLAHHQSPHDERSRGEGLGDQCAINRYVISDRHPSAA